jgi:HTH-type transcriptional regulator / antitoxin MqsA
MTMSDKVQSDKVQSDKVQSDKVQSDKAQTLPPTMPCPETGRELRRDTRPFTVRYKTHELVVDLPGYYPDGDGESVHIGTDMAAADEALRVLKEQVDGLPSPATIRRIRHKLRLSQRAAGVVFWVGARAFDKYERSLVEPSGPTIQLLRLLDAHPELIMELRPSEREQPEAGQAR